nr:uncharacterized protein LOC104088307 [Nicotiana tomentosiformis]
MTCGYCGQPNHNIRNCPLANDKRKHFFQDEGNSQSAQESQESASFFIPNPGLNQQNSQSWGQPSSQLSVLDYDSDPTLRPKVVAEGKTWLQTRMMKENTVTRKINFMGDHTGAVPTNLPYSPKKLTWKGKEAMTSTQLQAEIEEMIGKLKARRGRGM